MNERERETGSLSVEEAASVVVDESSALNQRLFFERMASEGDNESGRLVNKTHGLDLLLIELESTDSTSVGLVLRFVSLIIISLSLTLDQIHL